MRKIGWNGLLIVSGILLSLPAFSQQRWERNYGGTNSDFGYSVQQTSDGGYIVAGSTGSLQAALLPPFLFPSPLSYLPRLGGAQRAQWLGASAEGGLAPLAEIAVRQFGEGVSLKYHKFILFYSLWGGRAGLKYVISVLS